MKLKTPHLVAMVFAASIASSPGRADLITCEFRGETSVFWNLDGVGWTVPDGTSIWGRFTLDTTAVDVSPSEFLGKYYHAIVATTIRIGDDELTHTASEYYLPNSGFYLDNYVAVGNDWPDDPVWDFFQMRDYSLDFRGYTVSAGVFLEDDDATYFDSDLMPSTLPTLSEFDRTNFVMIAYDEEGAFPFYLAGPIRSLVLVPEPSTILLLGVSAVAYRRPRRGACLSECIL